MQNKAKTNPISSKAQMSANAFSQKDYDKEQRTINNERYSKQTQSKPISKAKKDQIYFFKLFITLAEWGAISARPAKILLVMKLSLPVFTIMAVVSAPAAGLRSKPRGRVSRTTQLETIVSRTSSIRIPQLSQLRMAQLEILKC